MSEATFRRAIAKNINRFVFTQIESHAASPGIPDTHYLIKRSYNYTGFLELKVERQKPNKIDLRKTQSIWMPRYWRAGGHCWVVVKIGRSTIVVWKGLHAKELRLGLNIWNIPHYEFNTLKDGWREFEDFLTPIQYRKEYD